MYCKVQYNRCFEFITILEMLPTDSCRGGWKKCLQMLFQYGVVVVV